ncbi:hypothetical protein Tco_0584464 [Tanacetum coccineum]
MEDPESPTEIRHFRIWYSCSGSIGGRERVTTEWFIEFFSKMPKPLTLLTQKNKGHMCWGDKASGSFPSLKEWETYAMLLCVFLKIWRHYLYGRKSVIYTDHKGSPVHIIRKRVEYAPKAVDRALSDSEWRSKYPPRQGKCGGDCLEQDRRLKPETSRSQKHQLNGLRGLERHFEQRADGEIYFFDRIWIPSIGDVRKLIMDEAHTSRYSVHPGADKLYMLESLVFGGMEDMVIVPVSIIYSRVSIHVHLWQDLQDSIGKNHINTEINESRTSREKKADRQGVIAQNHEDEQEQRIEDSSSGHQTINMLGRSEGRFRKDISRFRTVRADFRRQ